MANIVWVCMNCDFRSDKKELPNPHGVLNLCPQCEDKGKCTVLITLEIYKEWQLRDKLMRHFYCKSCGFIGLIGDFSLNGPANDICSEMYCPKCMGDDLINAYAVKLCTNCHARPVEDGDNWCVGCDEAYEGAMERERDFEPWD